MKKVIFLTLSLLSAGNAMATTASEPFDDALQAIQSNWAKTNYAQQDIKKEEFPALVDTAKQLTQQYPDKAEAWIWQGIVQSSYAGVKGGMGALSVLREAKNALEKALSIDESALDGSAHTSLGVLYFKVPGWPLSFGDDDEAEQHLQKALAMNPQGLDVNFFLAQYYIENKDYDTALKHLQLAKAAPKRPNRPLADKYRQEEVSELMAEVNAQMR